VVDAFIRDKDFGIVQRVQEKILAAYDDDISNHAKGAEKTKIRNCYRSLPQQLARDNKKFMYSSVEKKSTARKYSDSVEWLKDSNLVHVAHNVFEPYIPLLANAKGKEFKLYVNDSGLLMALYGVQSKLALLENTLLGSAKGGIYENVISELLIKNGHELYYYKTQNSSMEIEFVIEEAGEVVPVEVKAGNTSTASLNSYISKFKPNIAYKLVNGNIGTDGNRVTIPHYMVMFI